MPKYPEVVVELSEQDGNAFSILVRVRRAMRRADVDQNEIALFRKEATSGDYDNLLQTVMRWVTVE